MEESQKFNVYKSTKYLYAAAVYGIIAAVVFLLIPLCPVIQGKYNLYEYVVDVIDRIISAAKYSSTGPVRIIYLIAANWYAFALFIFTVVLIVKAVLVLTKIKRVKQFAVIITDDVYYSLLKLLFYFFAVSFACGLFFPEIFNENLVFEIPNAYVVLYGGFAVVGIIVNAVSKNLCAPLRLKKSDLVYYGAKIGVLSVLAVLAVLSTVLSATKGYTVYSAQVISSEKTGVFYVKNFETVLLNIGALVAVMGATRAGAFFQYFTIIIVYADICLVFVMLLRTLKRFIGATNKDVFKQVLTFGAQTEKGFFNKDKKLIYAGKSFGLTLLALGSGSLFLHLIFYPIVRAIEGISGNISFSLAPLLSLALLIFGVLFLIAAKYYNEHFFKSSFDGFLVGDVEKRSEEPPFAEKINAEESATEDVPFTYGINLFSGNDDGSGINADVPSAETAEGEPYANMADTAEENVSEDTEKGLFFDF